jgi:hypothetical protein
MRSVQIGGEGSAGVSGERRELLENARRESVLLTDKARAQGRALHLTLRTEGDGGDLMIELPLEMNDLPVGGGQARQGVVLVVEAEVAPLQHLRDVQPQHADLFGKEVLKSGGLSQGGVDVSAHPRARGDLQQVEVKRVEGALRPSVIPRGKVVVVVPDVKGLKGWLKPRKLQEQLWDALVS